MKKVEGTGSVWNSNSYHWEEKSVSKWSDETLRQIFTEFKVVNEGATFYITEVKELKGESSLSIRKQRKIVTFEYNAHLLWKCEIEKEGKKVVFNGDIKMPEISSDILDDGEEFDIVMSNLADAPDLDAGIKAHMATFTKNLVP